ncbi:VOC family protein [uncultured Sulfitobacter sp.]|uniref:VOC family protein n=1 Tax=uncultured Sulfitobacter sp. TaxID=191468 RepID=UPI002613F727|nr:VOC family protein [uncultured Sulfitobacter sp.]
MTHPTLGIDHCFALVNDLDHAAAQFKDLGFTLSPKGVHSEAKGSANYTIMFPDDYFELLGVIKATPLNAPRREMLARSGEGLHAIACRIRNAEAAAQALADLGIETYGLNSFERPVPLPDGSTGRAAFATLSYAPDEVPEGIVFMCEHRTPETVWLSELLTHENGACGLSAILALSADPERDAPRFARLWARGSVDAGAQGTRIDTGEGSAPLILMTPAQMAQSYPGIDLSRTAQGAFTALRLKTTDMDAATACARAAGITPVPTSTGIAIAPEHTSGTVLEFVPA